MEGVFSILHFHKFYFMAEVAEIPKKASDKPNAEVKKKIFGTQKKPDVIIYRMIKTNDRTQRTDTPLYPPYTRFPNKDIIVWEFTDSDGNKSEATREIRWLPGEQSNFVDEQEKDGRKIPENILNNPNNRFEIIDGDIRVRPHEKTKIQFLDMCNRNADSLHRTGTVASVFRKYTEEVRIAELKEKQSHQKVAIQNAFNAEDELVYFQAPLLNIPLVNNLTGASRDFESILTDYRQVAMDNPVEFLKIFDDEGLKQKFKNRT